MSSPLSAPMPAILCALLMVWPSGLVCAQSRGGTKSVSGDLNPAAIQIVSDIHQAARMGSPGQIRSLIARGFAPDLPDSNGITPLMYAAWFNPDPEVSAAFLDAGARMDYSPGSGWTPAVLASWNSNPAVFELLRNRGANVFMDDEYGTTPLMLAARFNWNPEVLKSVIRAGSAGSAVNARNRWGWTALMFAAESNPSPAILDLLLDEGSDMEIRDERGRTVWFLAATANPNPGIFTYLQQKMGEAALSAWSGALPGFSAGNMNPVGIQ